MSRDMFFGLPTKVGNSLVSLPALVADGLFLTYLIGSNQLKAAGACLDINRLKIFVDKDKLRLKKVPNPSEVFVRMGSQCMPVNVLRLLLKNLQFVKLFNVLSLKKSLAFLIVKLDWDLCSQFLNSQTMMALSTQLLQM